MPGAGYLGSQYLGRYGTSLSATAVVAGVEAACAVGVVEAVGAVHGRIEGRCTRLARRPARL